MLINDLKMVLTEKNVKDSKQGTLSSDGLS